jgi:methanol metabolism-related c-type cytochrome
LLVAEKFDPVVNWATKVDMDKSSKTYGRPLVVDAYSTQHQGEDTNSKGICPAALGTKDEQPAAYSPETQLFYVPTNHVCMDYEPYKVAYTAGQPYVGATLSMYPPKGDTNMGNFIAWDGKTGKIVWSNKEQFSAWGGALATAGGVVFYGTLEGYLKAVDAKTGKELYKFKTPSGIIGNVMTYEHGGKQYVASCPASAVGRASALRPACDWPVYNGFRRYNGICYVCHGPDGEGSSFAPALVDSLKTLSFDQFLDTVVNGKQDVGTANDKKMPSLGSDPNVMCYINDIYAYLKARSDGVVGRGRPAKFVKKSKDYADAENACMGTPG